MKRHTPITARDLAEELGVEVPVLLNWLRNNGHPTASSQYMLGEASESRVYAGRTEIVEMNSAYLADQAKRMPQRPRHVPRPDGRPVNPDNPFSRAQGMGRRPS